MQDRLARVRPSLSVDDVAAEVRPQPGPITRVVVLERLHRIVSFHARSIANTHHEGKAETSRLEVDAAAQAFAESQLALAALAPLCAGERDAVKILRRLVRRARPTLPRAM